MRREPGAAAGVTLAAFIAELRVIGLPISVSENVDATAAVLAMPMSSRQSLKSALAATLVKNNDHHRAFELVFDVFFGGDRRRPGQVPGRPGARHGNAGQRRRAARRDAGAQRRRPA